jgi:hypothetical protein
MDHSKKQYKNPLNLLLKHVPEELLCLRVDCPVCRTDFTPNWLETKAEPIVPIKPKYSKERMPYDGPGRWIPTATMVSCPKCNKKLLLNLPTKKVLTKGLVFGDEAHRADGAHFVYTYSLIGADHKLIPGIEERVKDLKRETCPFRPPDSWKLHMKHLWSGHNRRKHSVFVDWDKSEVDRLITGLFHILRNTENLFIYNFAVTSNQTGNAPMYFFDEKQLRDYAYLSLVLNVIDEFTEKGAQPYIFFDAEKPTRSEKAVQAWAREAFQSGQRHLLYTFVARGIEIPEPQFVTPASHPCLELADFVSYVVARYYLRKWQQKQVEMDPVEFGMATYLGFDQRGDILRRRQEGYPWDEFSE